MSLTSPLSSSEQESALRYLASRMMGDSWSARQLACELPTLSPAQQAHRLRAFLAAATISNTVAADICRQYGLVTGLPAAHDKSSADVPSAHGNYRLRHLATRDAAHAAVQSHTDQLLLINGTTHTPPEEPR